MNDWLGPRLRKAWEEAGAIPDAAHQKRAQRLHALRMKRLEQLGRADREANERAMQERGYLKMNNGTRQNLRGELIRRATTRPPQLRRPAVTRSTSRPREHRSGRTSLRRGPPKDDPSDPDPASPTRRRAADHEALSRDNDLVGDIRSALDRAAHSAPTEAHSADSLEELPNPSEWHLLSRLQRIQNLINGLSTVDQIEAVVAHVVARIEWMQRRGIES